MITLAIPPSCRYITLIWQKCCHRRGRQRLQNSSPVMTWHALVRGVANRPFLARGQGYIVILALTQARLFKECMYTVRHL